MVIIARIYVLSECEHGYEISYMLLGDLRNFLIDSFDV